MITYLIGYDLLKPGKDYSALIGAIKLLSGTWWHNLDSTWVIKHPGPATAIRNALRPHIDQNDRLIVVRLVGEGAWVGFNDSASKWLQSNL